MAKYKTYFAFAISAGILEKQGKSSDTLVELAESIDAKLSEFDSTSFNAHLVPFTDADNDKGFFVNVGHTFNTKNRSVFDEAVKLLTSNMESSFIDLHAQNGESVQGWLERFIENILDTTAKMTDLPFVAEANTEENQSTILSLIENAAHEAMINVDAAADQSSLYELKRIIRYNLEYKVSLSIVKLWYQAAWDNLYTELEDFVVENSLGQLAKHNGKFSRFNNKQIKKEGEFA